MGLDNDSVAWKAWKVDSWPTHFLVPRPTKSGAPLVKAGDAHVGDRGHDTLERAIVDALLTRAVDEDAITELVRYTRKADHSSVYSCRLCSLQSLQLYLQVVTYEIERSFRGNRMRATVYSVAHSCINMYIAHMRISSLFSIS